MTRKLFRGAPELSCLFVEAQMELVRGFVACSPFSELFGCDALALPTGVDEDTQREAAVALIRRLTDDRLALMEAEARRITALADDVPAALLLRLAEDRRFD